MNREKLIAAAKAGAKAFVIAFLGALGFAGFAPELLANALKVIGLN